MKITTNVDCTPDEARILMGLPDLKPMQEVLMRETRISIAADIRAMNPEALLKTSAFAARQAEAFSGRIQKMFMAQIDRAQTEVSINSTQGRHRRQPAPSLPRAQRSPSGRPITMAPINFTRELFTTKRWPSSFGRAPARLGRDQGYFSRT